uniref:Coiled-coil domain-containing protein 102A-like n=1 Tax=Nicotiana tabacum TaxID=4097 RepID=A0A1S3XHD6_TOBAC|nr:PREDICTED: coiled-coil domain-containing protein 102A-like [Nicotiana tabacum]
MPQAVPDLEDWVWKLASTSAYAERAWRDLAKGIWEAKYHSLTKDAILRPSSVEEETKSPIPKPGEDKKRKIASQSEDPKPKPRRVRRKVIALTMDSVQKLRDEEEDEEENALALTVRPRKAVEVTKPSEQTAAAKIKPRVEEASKKNSGEDPELPEVETISRSSVTTPDGSGSETQKIDQSVPSDLLGTMRAGHLPSLPTFCKEALREAQELKTPDIEEAQRLLYRAFAKFRADLSQCETELQRVSEERNALKLLCGQKDKIIKDLQVDLAKAHEEEAELDKQVSILLIKYGLDPIVEANTSLSQLQQKVEMIELLRGEVDQVKADCDWWKENMDRLAAEKETTSAKLSSAEVQLWGVKEKSSV